MVVDGAYVFSTSHLGRLEYGPRDVMMAIFCRNVSEEIR